MTKTVETRKKEFLKDLKELLTKHNAEFQLEDQGTGYVPDDKLVVYLNGNFGNTDPDEYEPQVDFVLGRYFDADSDLK